MKLNKFLSALGLQKPLVAIQGDIFDTPADHIAFAVHYPNKKGESDNSKSGFASQVYEHGWTSLKTIKFKAGWPVTKKIKGKYFHALPVHSNEEGGWEGSPELIQDCLNRLPVSSTEVVAIVLIGGGAAGLKYKASVRNIEGMVKSYKTVVLYVYEDWMMKLLCDTGVVVEYLPKNIPMLNLPKVMHYRDVAEVPELS